MYSKAVYCTAIRELATTFNYRSDPDYRLCYLPLQVDIAHLLPSEAGIRQDYFLHVVHDYTELQVLGSSRCDVDRGWYRRNLREDIHKYLDLSLRDLGTEGVVEGSGFDVLGHQAQV